MRTSPLKDLDHRNEVINTIHRALTNNGLAEERGVGQYALHGERPGRRSSAAFWPRAWPATRWASGSISWSTADHGRVHHMKFPDASHLKDIGRDMIVEVGPATLRSTSR